MCQVSEQRIWDAGIHDWEMALSGQDVPLSSSKAKTLRRHLEQSLQQLENNNPCFFTDGLPSNEHWRLFPEFRARTAYLDIETTGLQWPMDHITTIALYDGRTVRHYVHGQNLDQFKDDIQEYSVVVTYNGKCFDVPCIEACLGIQMPHAHIDMRYLLKNLGYAGGLKGCERQLGMSRQGLEDVDGFFAVLLWYEYEQNRNDQALQTLLAYNVEDVLTLERLLVFAYNQKVMGTPFEDALRLGEPDVAANPFEPDSKVIAKIREQAQRQSWY
jgi:uncharacterized protein YprB with RNaseH-like and TPR domain